MAYLRLFIRVTCAKLAFVFGLGIAPAIAANLPHPASTSVPAITDQAL